MYQNITSNIVQSIADRKNVDPNELEFVLADYVDLDAVEQLAKHSDSTWRLEFEIPDHSVTVKSDGTLLVDGRPGPNWRSE